MLVTLFQRREKRSPVSSDSPSATSCRVLEMEKELKRTFGTFGILSCLSLNRRPNAPFSQASLFSSLRCRNGTISAFQQCLIEIYFTQRCTRHWIKITPIRPALWDKLWFSKCRSQLIKQISCPTNSLRFWTRYGCPPTLLPRGPRRPEWIHGTRINLVGKMSFLIGETDKPFKSP